MVTDPLQLENVVCERSKREGSVGEWEVGKRVSPRGVGLSESSSF
jgi:hypothetical protein